VVVSVVNLFLGRRGGSSQMSQETVDTLSQMLSTLASGSTQSTPKKTTTNLPAGGGAAMVNDPRVSQASALAAVQQQVEMDESPGVFHSDFF